MNKIYLLSIFIAMVAAAVFVDWFRRSYGVPVTFLDLVASPVLLFATYCFSRNTFFKKSGGRLIDEFRSMSIVGNWAMVVIAVFILLLGLLALRYSLSAPLDYISGARGSMHGYTLGALGIFFVDLSMILVVGAVNALRFLMERSKRD